MLVPPTPTAILDANVLYPAPVRDYLLSLADEELYMPKWTDLIHDEWIRNLLQNRPDLKRTDLEITRKAMDKAFPEANITDFNKFLKDLSLPDPDDRHILAAAIKAHAKIIVTFNLKDFPQKNLKEYDVMAQHPDDFIAKIIEEDNSSALGALNKLVQRLRNPPKTADEVLETLRKLGLKRSTAILRKMDNIIHYKITE